MSVLPLNFPVHPFHLFQNLWVVAPLRGFINRMAAIANKISAVIDGSGKAICGGSDRNFFFAAGAYPIWHHSFLFVEVAHLIFNLFVFLTLTRFQVCFFAVVMIHRIPIVIFFTFQIKFTVSHLSTSMDFMDGHFFTGGAIEVIHTV